MDTKSLALLQQMHPKERDNAISLYNKAVSSTPIGVHPFIIQTYRSFEESQKLYNQGRTTPGEIVTWALPGNSWHNWGLALDFGLIINGVEKFYGDDEETNTNWEIVVKIFESGGYNWGHNFPKGEEDDPHLECKRGLTLSWLNEQYAKGNFIKGTNYINF